MEVVFKSLAINYSKKWWLSYSSTPEALTINFPLLYHIHKSIELEANPRLLDGAVEELLDDDVEK